MNQTRDRQDVLEAARATAASAGPLPSPTHALGGQQERHLGGHATSAKIAAGAGCREP